MMNRKFIQLQEEPKTWRDFFNPSVLSLMVYVDNIEGIHFNSFHYIQMTDELEVNGSYLGEGFNIFMMPGGEISMFFEKEISEIKYVSLKKAISSYKHVGFLKYKKTLKKFKEIAKNDN